MGGVQGGVWEEELGKSCEGAGGVRAERARGRAGGAGLAVRVEAVVAA